MHRNAAARQGVHDSSASTGPVRSASSTPLDRLTGQQPTEDVSALIGIHGDFRLCVADRRVRYMLDEDAEELTALRVSPRGPAYRGS